LPPSRKEIERDVDEELALHLEMRAKDFEREGLDPDSAKKKAQRRFGDTERYRCEMKGIKDDYVQSIERVHYFEEITNDIRHGFRQLMKKPALPMMIIVLLAIGVGANTAIFSVVKAVLLEPLPFEASDQLVIFWETEDGSGRSPASYPNFLNWREQAKSFEDIGVITYWHFNLGGEQGPERVFATLVSEGLFELLGVEPELGRTILPEEDRAGAPKVVLISHGLWHRRFGGDPGVIGEAILIDQEPFTVIGVMPPGFEAPSPWLVGKKTDVWFSLCLPPINEPLLENRDVHWMVAIGRLKDGVSIDEAQGEMNLIASRLEAEYPETSENEGVILHPLHEDLVGRAGNQLLMLLGGAGLVLLIVCGNVAGLLMAKATTRQTEVAVRSALGASRARLTRQILVENVPLTLLGGGLGFLLALGGLQSLQSIIPTDIPRIDAVGFDGGVFAFTLGISFITGVLFSLAPAWSSLRVDLVDQLKQGRGSTLMGASRNRARNLLVVAQFALTLVLANAAALMLQSYFELQDRDYGFYKEGVLTLGVSIQGSEYQTSTDVRRFYDELIERVEALPGVRSAAATSKLPLQGGSNSDIEKADGHDFSQGQTPFAEMSVVTLDYFQTMGIPLLRGRMFDDHDHMMSDLKPAIINEAMVEKLWPNEDPIGKHFEIFAPHSMTVVGVVGDVRQWGPEREAHPEVYMPLSAVPPMMQFTFKTVRFLVVRTDEDPLSLAGAVRQEVARVDPYQPISDIRTTADVLSSTLARRRFNTLLIGIFATIALILVAAGIYGVMSFFVAQRTHEIGIRVAMGARWSGVQRLVLVQGLKLAAIGIVFGLAGVVATTKLTESMVYGLSPTDPATLFAGAVFLVSLGLLGSLLPALRASRVDPILALRDE
jgi:putative ABC transport system permease protein